MKRGIKIALAVVMIASVMVLGITGCAKEEAAPAPAPPAPAPAKAEPIILKWADPSGYGSARTVAQKEWAEELTKRSGGLLQFEWYWAGSLAKAKDILPAVKGGLCDCGMNSSPSYHPTVFPITLGFLVPFIGGDDYHAHGMARYDAYRTIPELKKEWENAGVKPMCITAYEPTRILSTKPIKSLEDLKGVKVGAKGYLATWVSEAGGTPVSLTVYEYYEALQKGTADAVTTYTTLVLAFKMCEVAKYVNLTGLTNVATLPIMNVDVYNGLSDDLKKVIDDGWLLYHKMQSAKFDVEIEKCINTMKKDYGLVVNSITPEEFARWKAAATPAKEAWLADMKKGGIDGQRIYDTYEELYKKHSK